MFIYIYKGESHSDLSTSYMQSLGMNSEQIESVHNQYEYEREQVSEKRKETYRNESDHLFIKWHREELPEQKQAWLDKVAEIQARIPHLPELD